MPLTFTLLARKGGVGRTTMTMNLAGVWAKAGARVLVLDFDSQASLSRSLLGNEWVENSHEAETITAVFSEHYDPRPKDLIQQTAFENIRIVAAGDSVERFNATEPWKTGPAQLVVRDFLAKSQDEFDVCLIDTGPNTCGLLAWSSLCASDFVLSPVRCDAYGTQSIISVQRLVAHVRSTANERLHIAGYFINMWQKNSVMIAYEETLRSVHGSMVFETVLPYAAAFNQAVAERTPLVMKRGRSKAVQAVIGLAEEINERVCSLQKKKEVA